MPITFTSNGTSGFVPDSIFSYSYNEDITSIEPSTNDGGAGQLSISGVEIAPKSDNSFILSTRMMINDDVVLTIPGQGSVQGKVKQVSTNSAGTATVLADTVQTKLNVEKTALPFSGTLRNAIIYYCGLCGVVPAFDATAYSTTLPNLAINFIGWKGNVWEYLKMLCSGISTSATTNSSIEMIIINNVLTFRPALTSSVTIAEDVSDIGYSYEVLNSSKSIKIYDYNSTFITNGVVHNLENYTNGVLDLTKAIQIIHKITIRFFKNRVNSKN
jgi:hypothetical protein